MKIDIKKIRKKNYAQAHKFKTIYLGEELLENFIQKAEDNKDIYLVAMDKQKIIGICYGKPSRNLKKSFELQGIAVNLDQKGKYTRKGIGSKMLKKFEQEVKNHGFKKIDLGSADDEKVEKFYLKNGFTPYEIQAKGKNHSVYERQQVKNYQEGLIKKEELIKKHNPKEVIFIMKKEI